MRFTAVVLCALVCTSAFASDPGQPLDCSDWVLLQPGFSCSPYVPYFHSGDVPLLPGTSAVIDNEGRQLWILTSQEVQGYRYHVMAYDGVSTVEIGYIEGRHNPDGSIDDVRVTDPPGAPLFFDAQRGRLLVLALDQCLPFGACAYSSGYWEAAISGFATTFDVLQTFTPQPAAFGFRVPYMPEGMRAADHFDTYYGPLAHPIDFSAAQPLACGYPSTAPQVGDYIAVADLLPDPTPGTGRYYVTATTYQGQTRYGRKTSHGVSSGRDPALLPVCAAP